MVAPRLGHRTALEGGGLAACLFGASSPAACARSRTANAPTRILPTKWRATWNNPPPRTSERTFSRGGASRRAVGTRQRYRSPRTGALLRMGERHCDVLVGSALRRPQTTRQPWFYHGQRAHPGAGHRRQHGDFQRDRWRAAETSAVSAFRAPHRALAHRAGRQYQGPQHGSLAVLRLQRRKPRVSGRQHVERRHLQRHRALPSRRKSRSCW